MVRVDIWLYHPEIVQRRDLHDIQNYHDLPPNLPEVHSRFQVQPIFLDNEYNHHQFLRKKHQIRSSHYQH